MPLRLKKTPGAAKTCATRIGSMTGRILILVLGAAAAAAYVTVRRSIRAAHAARNGGRDRTARLRREIEEARERLRRDVARAREET